MSSKDAKKKTTAKDDFIEEDGDKRIIVFVAIAILIVIGIVIALLVGCEKQEEQPNSNNPGSNENKPNTDVVVPQEDDEEEKEEEGEKESNSVVTKTSTKPSSSNKGNKEETEEDEITTYYTVTFVYKVGNENKIKETTVEEGNLVSQWCPSGYENCEYYTDDTYQQNFYFTEEIMSDEIIYIKADEIIYTINYSGADSTNQTTYKVSEGEVELVDGTLQVGTTGIFAGWYTDSAYTDKVTSLSSKISSYANSNKEITIYAKIITSLSVYYYNDQGVKQDSKTDTKTDSNTFDISNGMDGNNSFACTVVNTTLLGWSTSQGNTINYNVGQADVKIDSDLTLHPVCGKAKVVYQNDVDGDGSPDEEIVKGYTEEEIDDFDLPDDEALDLEAPTYFVPVTEETDTSKKVIEDNATVVLGDEIKISEVTDKAAENYTPQVGDIVEEKEKVFDGWEKDDGDPNTDDKVTTDSQEPSENYTPTDGDTLTATWKEQEEAGTSSAANTDAQETEEESIDSNAPPAIEEAEKTEESTTPQPEAEPAAKTVETPPVEQEIESI